MKRAQGITRRRQRAHVAGMALACLGGCAGPAAERAALPRPEPDKLIAAGAGRYTTLPYANEKPPSNFHGAAVAPKVTKSFSDVPATNDWWSSLIWQYDREGKNNPHSEPLYAHPLTLKAHAEGLGVGSAGKPEIGPRSFMFPYVEDLLVGVDGLAAPATRVERYDDWTVTARWDGPKGASLRATMGHGLPFVYFDAHGGEATVRLGPKARVFADLPATLGIEVGGRAYGLFAPRGVTWERKGSIARAALGARTAFSVAVLPDARSETLARFRRHAFAFVTGSRVAWQYDAAKGLVSTRFALSSEARDPGSPATTPLVALYPHQWKHLARDGAADVGAAAYVSPRGAMKLLAAESFEVRLPFAGVLPVLPRPRADAGTGFDADELAGMVRAAARAGELFPVGLDGTKGTYWTGKSLLRVALLAWLAEQAGEPDARATFVAAMKTVLEDWFDGQPPNLFAYDRTWATLIGVPSEYRSGWELNDHHFHYGQFVFAAATVARFDPGWADDTRFGKMVDLLIKDCANPDRGDRRFPFLRHFDVYAGHSWANGPALFPEGNNQESSSEDLNFATGVILWGALTGKTKLRDLGVYLHATLAASIEQYWFDVDDENFPAGFERPALGMVWGAGGKYDTWWDRNPIYVHGINFLPFTGGSLHLGRRADYVRKNHAALVAANRGEPRLWREIIWMYLALADAPKALAQLAASPHYQPEFGVSRAFVYQWLHALGGLGQVDATVSADAPTAAAFRHGTTRHHVAFNPGTSRLRVKFSDGVVVDVPPLGEKVVSQEAGATAAAR